MSDTESIPVHHPLPDLKQLRISMNPILKDIMERGVVTDGETELPLKDHMDEA